MTIAPGALLFLLAACAASGAAQQHASAPAADTAVVNRILLVDPGISLGRPTFLIPSTTWLDLPFGSLGPRFPGDVLPYPRPFVDGVLAPRADLTLPLRLQMAKASGWGTVQMVLGGLGAGAVGYMAYHHIKKYGLSR